MLDNGLDIWSLTQRYGTFISVSCHFNSEQPVELAQISDFDVLSDVTLELIYFSQSHGGNSAIVNVNNDDDKLTGLSAPEVHSLIDGALGEAHFINEDLHQLLIPMTTTLF